MSRSRKKTPYFSYSVRISEKYDKRIANRRLRKAVKLAIFRGDEIIPIMREISNVWDMVKDGKHYVSDIDEKYMRK